MTRRLDGQEVGMPENRHEYLYKRQGDSDF